MNDLKLSKELSYALRHAPHEYELELDEQGWVDVEQLIFSLKEDPNWETISEADVRRVIERSDKKRLELKEGKIRALYGHSIPQKITKEGKEPPALLYHGTARRFVPEILANGLLPKGRQYVHLSVDQAMARQVGKRRDVQPVLLVIDAKCAWDEGVLFYQGNDQVWLADRVDSQYIRTEE